MRLSTLRPPTPARPRPGAAPGVLGAALLALLAAACASSGGRADARAAEEVPMRITLLDYLSGTSFELVNPAHTDPVAYYSRERSNASRKVVAAEIVAALVEVLEDGGFEDYAAMGRLPRGVRQATRGFEVEGPGGLAHWVVRSDSDVDERSAMNDCTKTFLDTYNLVMAYQAVENESGGRYFKGGGQPPSQAPRAREEADGPDREGP